MRKKIRVIQGLLRADSAFTLIELLSVLAVITLLVSLAVPAINGLSKGGDVDAAANSIFDAVNEARAYAMANNTYAWVGFFEESAAQNSTQPATAGVGRVVVDTVASADGTLPYSTSLSGTTSISSSLVQVARLTKVQNTHLVTFPVAINGNTISSPGAVAIQTAGIATIGSSTPSAPSLTTFTYPLTGTAQYTFTKSIEFSPRGEARIDNSTVTYPLQPAIEVGLQPTRGARVDATSLNLVSIQVSGLSGDAVIYRR